MSRPGIEPPWSWWEASTPEKCHSNSLLITIRKSAYERATSGECSRHGYPQMLVLHDPEQIFSSIFNPKKRYQALGNVIWDVYFGSQIQDHFFYTGYRNQKSTASWIRIRNTSVMIVPVVSERTKGRWVAQ
jgi:hypothetical protein